jgi:hypothetical protein
MKMTFSSYGNLATKFSFYSIFIMLFSTYALVSGCENSAENDKLNSEIMAVHDEVMPKMGELNTLKQKIKAYKDAVPDDNSDLKDSLINTFLLLSKSEDHMDDWMGNYRYPNPQSSKQESKIYLLGQKDSVKILAEEIKMGLAIGKSMLSSAPDSLK